MSEEVFEVVHGQLVFATQNACNQAETAIRGLFNRPAFKDASEQTVFQTGPKYGGAGTFSLVATAKFIDRADADAVWDIADARWNLVINGSMMYQATVTQDTQAGTSSSAVVHNRHKPARPEDV